ncbi:MAG TPA: SpoIIE family protein phosphatase [Candidatus Acidoferrales bacterium]|jgi:sigma-B regulation protein RsbU (phosphoserine phosphatase)|nr:SpoIIE family protein phosphatase [Candidatus Acidoferrales bacterium]
MAESDGAATQTARILEPEVNHMPGIVDPYIREQLEKRRDEIKILLSSIPASEPATATAPFVELLGEVDSAVQRMDAGTYGICDVCHDTVEKERLISDPLTKLCLDHLSSDEQRALERDLELASQVQRGLLPNSDAEFRDWRVHYQYKPAGMVSGDYFDLIAPAKDDGGLIFLLGDVSGKGVAASLLMTHLHAMFRTLAGANMELCQLIEMANRLFCQSTTAGQYATLVCGRAGRSGEIEIASAGHAPALVISSGGVKQFGSTGLPLGLFATSGYTIHRLRLEPGDSLLLFTDGISEANDTSGREYGIAGISIALAGRHGWPPKELVAACLGDVHRYSAGVRQADDQTLMAIQRLA